ncbi:MAG: hypothetical protein ABIY48_06505 [Acidimicrobiales bacterium]
MRFVLCDTDQLYTSVIEVMLNDLGHTVVGVGTTTASSVALIEAARPDVVIADLTMGVNTDFDMVVAAAAVGATTIVFSQTIDDLQISHYPTRPTVVFKPDLADLEGVVRRLGLDNQARVVAHDRRTRPARSAGGPIPTSINDAQAFYEALNGAAPGDVLVSVEVPETAAARLATEVAERVRAVMRVTDRLLASTSAVRIFLPGGDDAGDASFRARLHEAAALPDEGVIRSVVISASESPGEAFERLRSADPDPH